MNKLIALLTLIALTLPVSAIAQAQDDRPRPDRDRASQRDRPERPDRSGDRARPGDRDGERKDHRSKREPLTVDQIDEAIATLRAMHGDAKMAWLQRIENLAKDNPEEAAMRLSRFPRLRELMDTRQNRPEEFELRSRQSQLMREVFPLVRKVQQARKEQDEEKAEELRLQLRERFEGLFEVRLKLKEIEIQRIRKHLGRAEKELAEIKADRDRLIDEKLNELMNKGFGPREDGDRPQRPGRDERRPKPDRPEH